MSFLLPSSVPFILVRPQPTSSKSHSPTLECVLQVYNHRVGLLAFVNQQSLLSQPSDSHRLTYVLVVGLQPFPDLA
ncbi:hypothetical protein BDZ91DRAFT_748103 [Kalaharituber pfeilii]|nr:hypothetical protein BDZ91DRAFT_748103 [Kalaharituber pfeilii]